MSIWDTAKKKSSLKAYRFMYFLKKKKKTEISKKMIVIHLKVLENHKQAKPKGS